MQKEVFKYPRDIYKDKGVQGRHETVGMKTRGLEMLTGHP